MANKGTSTKSKSKGTVKDLAVKKAKAVKAGRKIRKDPDEGDE